MLGWVIVEYPVQFVWMDGWFVIDAAADFILSASAFCSHACAFSFSCVFSVPFSPLCFLSVSFKRLFCNLHCAFVLLILPVILDHSNYSGIHCVVIFIDLLSDTVVPYTAMLYLFVADGCATVDAVAVVAVHYDNILAASSCISCHV